MTAVEGLELEVYWHVGGVDFKELEEIREELFRWITCFYWQVRARGDRLNRLTVYVAHPRDSVPYHVVGCGEKTKWYIL